MSCYDYFIQVSSKGQRNGEFTNAWNELRNLSESELVKMYRQCISVTTRSSGKTDYNGFFVCGKTDQRRQSILTGLYAIALKGDGIGLQAKRTY